MTKLSMTLLPSLLLGLLVGVGIVGCQNDNGNAQNNTPSAPPSNSQTAPSEQQALTQALNEVKLGDLDKKADLSTTNDKPKEIAPIELPDGRIQIDWALVDSKTERIDPSTFAYPFAIDSEPVKNYANTYQITPAQAQHSMVLAMASPEVLGKLLDQLDSNYVGHHLTDGANMSLVITVKPKVVADKYEYVFADNFAKGLVLPVVIEHKK